MVSSKPSLWKNITNKKAARLISLTAFIDDFSQLSTQGVRNRKLPAMRVGNKGYTKKSPQYYNRVVQT